MAPPAPLVALQDATVGFGGRPLFAGLSLGLQRGERLCLVGRNGCGKSTLLRTLAGQQPLDGGERVLQPGIKVAYLPQDPVFAPGETLAGYLAGGLTEPAAGHRVEAFLAEIGLPAAAELARLSGGERRRAAIARALIGEPDVLLLDEPTNHLDLPGIAWLENRIGRFRGALLVISHDRAFLKRAVTATLWLDRGALKRLDKPFAAFEEWVQNQQALEAEAQHKLDRQIVREEKWLQRGVTARRKRNQGRLRRLQELRQNRRDWLQAPGSAKLSAALAEGGGKLVIEATGISKSYRDAAGQPHPVVKDFSTRLRRGERLGIIGANGAGKTTLARLLIGDLAPDSGSVKLGSNLRTLYFDQRRDSLDPDATLWETLVPGGGDSITVQGRQRHVVSYLRDFLFDENQVRQPVHKLSGGERNRLLLARLFAQPTNLLVLDEPTNDLDLETLDLLEEVLSEFEGTLLLVSHDRDFLDRLVTGVLLVEGDGRVIDFAGGYSDAMLAQQDIAKSGEKAIRKPASTAPRPKSAPAKLSYKEQRALERLPVEIDELTASIARLEDKIADPHFYERDPGAFGKTVKALEETREQLAAAEEAWLLLEERREQLAAGGPS